MIKSVAVIGHDRAGKSTVSALLQAAFGWEALELGQRIRREQDLDPSLPRVTSLAAEELRRTRGPEIVVQWLSEVGISRERPGIIVGIRSMQTFEQVVGCLGQVVTVAIDAPLDARIRRELRTEGAHSRLEEAAALHASWGLDNLLRGSSIRIVNAGTLEELHEAVLLALPCILEKF